VIELDRKSLLVNASGDVTVGALEDAMRAAGLTLDLEGVAPETTVKALVEGGFRGARSPWGDPADHLIAGVTAREVACGMNRALIVRPIPRRATGPDLLSLVVGCGGRLYAVESAWLRVHHREHDRAARPAPVPFAANEPPLSPDEEELWDRVTTALASPT
jgi:alkyldihydroxyacetonephosphate synthase